MGKFHIGVSVQGEDLKFHWGSNDSGSDILSLDMSNKVDDSGIRYIYGYVYSDTATPEQKKLIRNKIENYLHNGAKLDDYIFEFIDWATCHLADHYQKNYFTSSHYPLENFSAYICIKSWWEGDSSLLGEIASHLLEYCHNPDILFEELKKTYEHVKFDESKILKTLIETGYAKSAAADMVRQAVSQFENLRSSWKLFQAKELLPERISTEYYDFLQFESKEEREIYETLQGVEVLIYNDFLLSSSIVKKIIKYLKAINDKNEAVIFVLVKQ